MKHYCVIIRAGDHVLLRIHGDDLFDIPVRVAATSRDARHGAFLLCSDLCSPVRGRILYHGRVSFEETSEEVLLFTYDVPKVFSVPNQFPYKLHWAPIHDLHIGVTPLKTLLEDVAFSPASSLRVRDAQSHGRPQ